MKENFNDNEMATAGQDIYHGVGQDHWWLTGKYEIICRFFQDYGGDCSLVLDVGCGPGNLMKKISSLTNGRLVGLDLAPKGLNYAKVCDSQNLVLGDMTQGPFKDASIDFVLAIDVCEHVSDDLGLIREIYRVLKPTGRALLAVPAHPILWGEHDERFGHFRRYYLNDFRRLINKAGFVILKLTYMQSYFFLPFLFFRKVKAISGSHTQDFFPFPPLLNRILHRIVSSEYLLLRRHSLPIGTNILCVVKKVN
jgi:SAM-dependent methyltransferase